MTTDTTVRPHGPAVEDDALLAWLDPGKAFPTAAMVRDAATLFSGPRSGWVQGIYRDGRGRGHVLSLEPRDYFVSVAGGCIGVRATDTARTERTLAASRKNAAASAWTAPMTPGEDRGDWLVLGPGDVPLVHPGRRERVITEWSRKSRASMTRALAELDYTPLFAAGHTPAMVTLTYPGAWQVVAPRGEAVKRHLRALLLRWARAWYDTTSVPCLWKLEFQSRGAPHFHLFATIPTGEIACSCPACKCWCLLDGCDDDRRVDFRTWLSHQWADVVAHPDREQRRRHRLAGTGIDYREGAKARDPKRLAVYFAKHGGAAGGKEYQHHVPLEWQHADKGPGRFWGYRGLDRVAVEAHIDADAYVRVRRTLRRLAQSRRLTVQLHVSRGRLEHVQADANGEVLLGPSRPRQRRKVTRRRRPPCQRGGLDGGFVIVNAGTRLAEQLSRL